MTHAEPDSVVADDAAPPTSPPAPEGGAPHSPAVLTPRTEPSGAPNLAAALAAAQGEIVNPAKGAENPHYKSRYANLVDGLRAIKGPLAKHAIAVVQCTRMQDDLLILTTRLIHDSGEWIEGEWPVANWTKLTPQQMGSALTYARRYSLFSLVGISGADDDDDAAAASAAADDPVIDMDDVVYIEMLLRDTDTGLTRFLEYVKAPSIAEMRLSQYKRGLARLEDKKRKLKAEGGGDGTAQ